MDFLLSRNVGCVCVLDISRAALDRAAARIGEWPVPTVDIWHDRAVFHFLADDASRQRYRARLREAVPHSGNVIIATFAQDDPEKCSGLPVIRHSPESLEKELGAGFRLVEAVRESHATPSEPFMNSGTAASP